MSIFLVDTTDRRQGTIVCDSVFFGTDLRSRWHGSKVVTLPHLGAAVVFRAAGSVQALVGATLQSLSAESIDDLLPQMGPALRDNLDSMAQAITDRFVGEYGTAEYAVAGVENTVLDCEAVLVGWSPAAKAVDAFYFSWMEKGGGTQFEPQPQGRGFAVAPNLGDEAIGGEPALRRFVRTGKSEGTPTYLAAMRAARRQLGGVGCGGHLVATEITQHGCSQKKIGWLDFQQPQAQAGTAGQVARELVL